MNIRSIASGVFAVFLFMGFSVSEQATENGMTTDIGFVPAAIAGDDKDKDASSPAALICKAADEMGGDAKDTKDKADKSEKEAKDSKDKADKSKADLDKDASDKDKKNAKDKADKADENHKDAKDKADKADKGYEDAKKGATDKAPCTTPDGKPGFWTPEGESTPTSGKPTPAAFRELHGN